MAEFREVFRNQHVILPVIHVETTEQTLRNADIAMQAGCDGVFLISMRGMDYEGVLEIHDEVGRQFPDLWTGVNFLDLRASSVFHHLNNYVKGVWVDNAGIDERFDSQPLADTVREARASSSWYGLYFGGVAFKYQREVWDVDLAAGIAKKYVDVVTTTGNKTGQPPTIRKIQDIRDAIGNYPLAIASGISPENIDLYRGLADCFLVATSLFQEGTEDFDPQRVKALVQVVRD